MVSCPTIELIFMGWGNGVICQGVTLHPEGLSYLFESFTQHLLLIKTEGI